MKPEDRKQIALIEHCANRIHEKAEQACKYCYDKFGVENSPDGLLEDIAEMALSIQVQAGNLCASRDAHTAVAVNEQMLEVVKKHLSNLEAQEFENVRYDRCGDFAHYVCASCSARKLPNGEKEPHASTCGWFDHAESLKSLVAAAEAEAAKGGV